MLRWLLAALHLPALGIGLGAVWVRAGALRGPFDPPGLRRIFAADSWWAFAGALWIATGLWRLLAGTEKPTAYYLHNHFFYLKMTALLLLLLMEARAVVLLIRWRASAARGRMGGSLRRAWVVAPQLRSGDPGPDHGRRCHWHGPGIRLVIARLLLAATALASPLVAQTIPGQED